MKLTQSLIPFIGLLSLAACGGGGGGAGGGSSSPAPVASNLAPTISTEALVLGSSGQTVTLTATASDPDGDTLTYTWSQTRGVTVTEQQGFSAATMSFRHNGGALSDVETLGFTVQVSDGRASATATANVLIAKDASRAVFVDGEAGSDSIGTGSLVTPFASIGYAADNATDADVYVRTLPFDAAYEEEGSSISLTNSRSIYGGFDENWVRDIVDNKTIVRTGNRGLRILANPAAVEVSGLDVTASSPRGRNDMTPDAEPINVTALYVSAGNEPVRLLHNVFESESAVPTTGFNYGGSSIAVQVFSQGDVIAADNMIFAGDGNASTISINPGGLNNVSRNDGGAGGSAGREANENGGSGQRGESYIAGSCGNGGSGGSGAGAEGGNGSDGQRGCLYGSGANGVGGTGFGRISTLASSRGFAISRGSDGRPGITGGGGGGGGGGEAANGLGLDGGAGGRGGFGGRGGAASPGSLSGGASIGIEVTSAASLELRDLYIRTGNGGRGGDGSSRNDGEAGSNGASGGKGVDGVFNDGGDGGDGGSGASGSASGIAGAGGGGPSIAVMLDDVVSARIENNEMETGNGGAGGTPFIPAREAAGVPRTHGKGGFSVGVFHWKTDQLFASLANNTYMLGSAGAGGRPNSSIGTGVSEEVANPDTPLPFN
ncbi:MAG: hypothetical protein AAF417_15370 [Pseudomonadota bacterium]